MAGPLFFVAHLVSSAIQLFMTIYSIITLSDIECDYINAQECCKRLNQFVLPEMVLHTFFSTLFLFTGNWILLALNLPLIAWHIVRYQKVSKGRLGVYDPTEIHNRANLRQFQREVYAKLGFHLIMFFLYIYNLVVALVTMGDS
ncbi:protein cornichon homolog 4-like [Sycon ciliatum]|uniref:protein cornichon homolog 4-like n=1 Tax=Sycon ciliatum TaxID=27933 RepID=UPI0020A8EB4F|eukprot:scpid97339/ scgid20460/ Protein cornichon homolog 4